MAFRVPVLEKFSWQEPVKAIVTEVPVNPAKGDRYIVGVGATGDFTTHVGSIAWYDGTKWMYDAPALGWKVFNLDNKSDYSFQETGWTNKQNINGLELTGDIDSSSTAVNWILKDNDANSLNFRIGTEDGPVFANYNTTDDAETLTLNTNVVITGNMHVQGEVTEIQSTNLTVEDPIFTLNKGGDATTARGAGFEVQVVEDEATSIIGYVRTTAIGQNAGYEFLAPGSTFTYTIALDPTVEADVSVLLKANLSVLAACVIDQNLSTTSDVKFNSVETTEDITVGGDLAVTGATSLTGTADIAGALTVGTVDVPAATALNGNLVVNGLSTLNDNVDVNGDLSVSGSIVDADDANSVTVANLRKSYDSRAIYDTDLECIVFDSDLIDRISTSAPALVSISPATSSTVNPTDTFTFTFDAPVKAGAGYIKFIDAESSALVQVDITSAAVSFAGSVVTVNLTDTPLTSDLVYGVEIDATAIVSESDVAYPGVAYNPATYAVSVSV